MADRAKFADAVVDRFAGSAASAAPDDDVEDAPSGDAEAGRMLIAAIKRGDGAAVAEAVKRCSGA